MVAEQRDRQGRLGPWHLAVTRLQHLERPASFGDGLRRGLRVDLVRRTEQGDQVDQTFGRLVSGGDGDGPAGEIDRLVEVRGFPGDPVLVAQGEAESGQGASVPSALLDRSLQHFQRPVEINLCPVARVPAHQRLAEARGDPGPGEQVLGVSVLVHRGVEISGVVRDPVPPAQHDRDVRTTSRQHVCWFSRVRQHPAQGRDRRVQHRDRRLAHRPLTEQHRVSGREGWAVGVVGCQAGQHGLALLEQAVRQRPTVMGQLLRVHQQVHEDRDVVVVLLRNDVDRSGPERHGLLQRRSVVRHQVPLVPEHRERPEGQREHGVTGFRRGDGTPAAPLRLLPRSLSGRLRCAEEEDLAHQPQHVRVIRERLRHPSERDRSRECGRIASLVGRELAAGGVHLLPLVRHRCATRPGIRPTILIDGVSPSPGGAVRGRHRAGPILRTSS